MDKTSISCTIKIFKYLVFKIFQNKSEKKCHLYDALNVNSFVISIYPVLEKKFRKNYFRLFFYIVWYELEK